MLRVIDLRSQTADEATILASLPRAELDVDKALAAVMPLMEDVRVRGEAALHEQTESFDHTTCEHIRVPQAEIDQAVADMSAELRTAIEESIHRQREASAAQLHETVITELGQGARVIQRWRPVRRVGLYVPGGKAVYPSSVIMNVVPAQTAGVAEIAVASPAQSDYDGHIHPLILAVCGLLGVTHVYAMGGAGAIAAFAYGVPSLGLAPVDVITGPGNIYVAAAKRIVRGVCGIDAEAGPTEIMVLADATADPDFVASDLLSQAEHDEQAGSVLVTTDADFAREVDERLEQRVAHTPNRERATTALTGPQSGTILVNTLDDAVAVANAYGAEHLEIQTEDPHAVAERIDNAGAIFLGGYSPVSLGDYSSGSNHVLPTGGQARFSAALGTYSFIRPQQIIDYSKEGLGELADGIVAFARAEHLPAHGEAVSARFGA
ncbi:MAG TPA: histidinol dehydrogenase [Pseudoclavibacter sp.]|nr:histidinol dehydrogenase [Pseudoclavibacter sp.]